MDAATRLDARSEIEITLADLRSTEIAKVLMTLKGIPKLKGYPETAQALLPALVWIKESGVPDLAQEADVQARGLGWPERYCLSCLRKFASRQDKIYKLMGLSALAKIVWRDPEAMLALVEISKNTRAEVNTMARGIASEVGHTACGGLRAMTEWNKKLEPLMGRMQTAFGSGDWRLRPLAEAMLKCGYLAPDLQTMLRAFIAKRPRPEGLPTPEGNGAQR